MLMIQRWIGIGILSLLTLPLMAQKGLQVNTLFDGRFKKDHRAVEVLIKGKELKKYHLSLFRSITVTNAKSAVDKEVGTIGNRLYYGFYCFSEEEGTFRYLFYRNTSVKPEREKLPEATVVYMEGQVTLEELKQLFQ